MITIIEDGNDGNIGFTVRDLVRWCERNIRDEKQPTDSEGIQDWADRVEGEIDALVKGYDAIRGCFLTNDGGDCLLRSDGGKGIKTLEYYALILSNCAYGNYCVSPELSNVVLKQSIKDIMLVTRARYADDQRVDKNDDDICSVVVPSLLRIIESLMKLTHDWDEAALTKIAAVLLCFSHESVDILPPTACQHDLMQDCAVPMKSSCIVDTESWSIERAFWKDSSTVHSSFTCWNALATLLNVSVEEEQLIEIICQRLGWAKVARAVRTQFFGKEEGTELICKKQKMQRIYPLNIEAKLSSEPAHRVEPPRKYAVMTFVKSMPSPNATILSEMLPVCYTLIDSSVATLAILGARALAILLERSNSTGDWAEFEDSLFSVLDMALKVASSNAVTVRHVCFVCSKACQFLSHRDKERRAFTHRFLELIHHNTRCQSDEDGLLRGILICGVIPILKQQSDIASAMDIGRFGLYVLLPLLRWDFGISGRKVQVAAMAALINLMVAAYPIMPNHGAKIMSQLLATWGHAFHVPQEPDDETKNLSNITLSLSRHASAVALLICGERAEGILNQIELLTYTVALVEHVSEVRKAARRFKGQKVEALSMLGYVSHQRDTLTTMHTVK